MTGKQMQKLIDLAQTTQVGMAKLLGIGPRQMRRYIADEAVIPRTVEIAVKCVVGVCEHKAETK